MGGERIVLLTGHGFAVPYVTDGATYDDYGPAYGYGVNSYNGDRSFEDVEPELAEGWLGARGASTLGWGEASPAARDAWKRVGARSNRGI